jgi:hypothetical protein
MIETHPLFPSGGINLNLFSNASQFHVGVIIIIIKCLGKNEIAL